MGSTFWMWRRVMAFPYPFTHHSSAAALPTPPPPTPTTQASYVMDAWERRWAHRPAGARPPRPLLMHSNLESFEEIVQLSRHAEHALLVCYAWVGDAGHGCMLPQRPHA